MDKPRLAPEFDGRDNQPAADPGRPMTPDELTRFEEHVIHDDSTPDSPAKEPLAPKVPPD
jgi:hypothetical protein